MSDYIARFNPYNMDDDTVLSVATGREPALEEVMVTLRDNLTREGAHQHLMVYGPRGRGKSFFLKYFGIRFGQDPIFQNCRFVSLPEEQSNVRFASDVVRMILSQIEGSGFQSVIPLWREPEELWQEHYTRLENWCRAQKKKHHKFLLVVVLENFNDLLETLDDAGLHRIRHLMEHLPGFTLIGASPRIHVDGDYNNPIFHIFKPIMLATWDEGDYLTYFGRRRDLESARTGRKWSATEIRLQDAKLKAISQFTGGSPRMAVVLTDLLLKDNLVSTAQTLYGLVDELTPYYQDLIKELRKRANSLALFDALIRHGENLSQSELADRVGARQNEISKAFSWLHENGYVTGKKRQGSKEFRYYVSDRVFVLYYLRREVLHNESYTSIWLLADFLVEFYSEEELRQHAFYHVIQDPSPETRDILRVWMRKKGMPEERYKKEQNIGKLLNSKGMPQNAYAEVAMNLAEKGEYEKAMEYCEKVLNDQSQMNVGNIKANIYAAKAYVFAQKGDLEQASELLKEALSFELTNDELASTYALIGTVESELKQFETAIEHYRKALELNIEEGNIKEQASNLGQIGWNLEEISQYETAIENHQKAAELHAQIENIDYLAWNLGRIGWNLEELKQHEAAIEHHKKAVELYRQAGNIEEQALNLEWIGWNLKQLKQYDQAIEHHKKAVELYQETGNIEEQALNLEWIGWNLKQLKQCDQAIEHHKKASELYRQAGNTKEQASNLEWIGLNFKELKQYEVAIEHHKKASELYQQVGDIDHEAWNLGEIGGNVKELQQYEVAVEHHKKAAELYQQVGDIEQQAWNLGRIGWNLEQLKQYEAAIGHYQKAAEFYRQAGNTGAQAWNLGRIEWNLGELKQYEVAIEHHKKAAELYQQSGNIEERAWNIGQIGWNFKELRQYEAANPYHEQALALQLHDDPTSDQSWNIGQICVNLYLSGHQEAAWQRLLSSDFDKSKIFRQWGDIVIFKQRHENTAAAFQAGNEILHALWEHRDAFDLPITLTGFFADMMTMEISNELFTDLAMECKQIFVRDFAVQTIADAALAVTGYQEALKSGKGEIFLENLHPDMAIAVQAIAREMA